MYRVAVIDRAGVVRPGRKRVEQRLYVDGCIVVETGQPAIIRLAPRQSTLKSLSTLEEYLRCIDSAVGTVRLDWHDGGDRRSEIVPSGSTALQRIISLSHGRRSERFLSRRMPPEAVHAHSPLSPMRSLWQQASGRIDMRVHGDAIGDVLDTYLTAYLEDGAVRFGEIGRGWKIYRANSWVTRCLGQRVEDQPDVAYGAHVARTYAGLWNIREPVVHDCDMIIWDPTGGGEKRVTYTRMVLPVTGRDGRRHILNAAYRNASVALRGPFGTPVHQE